MSACVNKLSPENASLNYQNATRPNDESPSISGGNKDGEEVSDEDEDVDFNPFLKETPSPAASSSLSSEIEALDCEIVNSQGNNGINSSKTSSEDRNHDEGDSKNAEEESTIQSNVLSEKPCERDYLQKTVQRKCKRKKSESLSGNSRERDNNENCVVEANDNEGDLGNSIESQKLILNSKDEDAICMRTRARYSLASFTLDELEAFLQETDDEDEIQNVNDEEEYRKFLAAVLQGGYCEGQSIQENENSDDYDEDNDADFEIELEEALESDDEEGAIDKCKIGDNNNNNNMGLRPETRRNRQQNVSTQHEVNVPEQAKRPLRPFVPILPSASITPLDRRNLMAETGFMMADGLVNGFSPPQLRQLHSLIHEHVQLLIQVYSLCVLDPSRHQIATQVQGLISEMLHKHEELITCRSEPHSFISGHVLSVTDVPPLNLAGRYMEDVSTAIWDYRRRQVESSSDTSQDREPLFPLPHYTPQAEANSEVLRGNNSLLGSDTGQSSSGQQNPKKTLAATLVETAKKQSVALVPKGIAKLAQRFFPLFNPLLFPHKPPPVAVANRVLFTDAEDDLLALGIIEYNSDWKAIQRRFLPCKSKHQIFVRQKNRCSSKAPENPIKAVRRMKSAPFTAEEIACIQEGLRYFKFDWMSVWKFIVPYRDPSLLPRQWRIALGVQKSYKQDAAKKEKRRLYELKRRCRAPSVNRWLASDKEDCHAERNGDENNVGDDSVETAGEAYVHEGFLADWRPGISDLFSSQHHYSESKAKDIPGDNIPFRDETHTRGRSENSEHRAEYGASQIQTVNCSHQPAFHPSDSTHFGSISVLPNHQVSNKASTASRPQIVLRPYRARKSHNARIVRLAPELPPVNLPPSVRIISQSDFRKNHPEMPSTTYTAKSGISDVTAREKLVPRLPRVSESSGGKNEPLKDRVTYICQDETEGAEEIRVVEERNSDPDIQMHPLLFRNLKNGQLAYYSSSSLTSASRLFSFFSENRLFNSPRQVSYAVDQFQKVAKSKGQDAASGSIDFHSLLNGVDDANSNFVIGKSSLNTSVGSEGGSCQLQNASGAVKKPFTVSEGLVGVSSKPSTSSGRTKEVNLNIHQSSTPQKVKGSSSNLVDSRNTSGTQNNHPAVCAELVSEVPCGTDEIGDQSNLGIVMEQEELSDSDEDMEEDVEFEREEMADSEGSGCEEIAEMQDKDVQSPTVEKADSGDEQGIRNPIHSEGITSVPETGSPFSRLSVTELGKDSMSSPWLSLDSCSRHFSRKAIRHEDKATTKEPTNKTTTLLYRPSRSCKKTTPTKKKVRERKEVVGIAQLLSLGPLAVQAVKKPRKRVCRANISINDGMSRESSGSDDKDKS